MDAIEERKGLAADRVPPIYLDAWARLNSQRPFDVSEAEWRQALDDGGRFLDAFGGEAADEGWTSDALFDRKAGPIWRLAGASHRSDRCGPRPLERRPHDPRERP